MSIESSLRRLQEEIASACAACGRTVDEITLVAVSKTVPASAIREAYLAGVRDFGENRVQELTRKAASLGDLDFTWHMVGRLQTNKVRALLPHLGLLHSLDRIHLAETIGDQAGAPVRALIQVNTTREGSKAGVAPEELEELVEKARALKQIRLEGLMTIGPTEGSEDEIRRSFALLRELREKTRRAHPDLPLPVLSMGMSGDFPLAIAEGATMLRIGSRIFGPRPH